MDKKDRNSLWLAAGGTAVAGMSMLATNNLDGWEMTGDALKAVELILDLVADGGSIAAAIGLLRLATKYGKAFYEYLKKKFNSKTHSNENDKSLTKQNLKTSVKSNSNNLKADLKHASDRGVPINQATRRSARNPVPRAKSVSKTLKDIRSVQNG